MIAHRHACYGAWQGYNAALSVQTPDVSEHWWRMREAALLAAGDAFSALADADEEAGGALTYMPALSIQPLLNDVLKQVISQCDVHVTQYPSWSLSCCCNSLRSLVVWLNMPYRSRRIWQLVASRTGRLSWLAVHCGLGLSELFI